MPLHPDTYASWPSAVLERVLAELRASMPTLTGYCKSNAAVTAQAMARELELRGTARCRNW